MNSKIKHKDYTDALLVIEDLIDIVEDKNDNSPYLKKFLDASNIIEAYEEENYKMGVPSLIDVIRLRMDELKLKNKDLAVLLDTTPSRVSEYLSGKREITLNVARLLNKRLNIDSDIILQ